MKSAKESHAHLKGKYKKLKSELTIAYTQVENIKMSTEGPLLAELRVKDTLVEQLS